MHLRLVFVSTKFDSQKVFEFTNVCNRELMTEFALCSHNVGRIFTSEKYVINIDHNYYSILPRSFLKHTISRGELYESKFSKYFT